MVHVNIHSKERMMPSEIGLLSNMLFIMCTNPEFAEEKEALISENLSMTRHVVDADGNEIENETKQVTYEEFSAAVHKGLETVLQLSIETPNGTQMKTVPFFPVTMVDIPLAKKAMITLDYVPDFLPKFEEGKLGFMFRGELMEFAQQDINEQED